MALPRSRDLGSPVFVGALLILATVALLGVPAFATDFQHEFHLSAGEVGLLTTVFTVPYVLIQIPAGIVASIVGSRRVGVVCMLALAVCSLATAVVHDLGWLIAFRALGGLAAGVLLPIASAFARTEDPEANRSRQAAIGAGWGLGYLLGLFGLPLIVGDWRSAFVAIGAFSLVLGVYAQLGGAASSSGPRANARETARSIASPTTWYLGTYLFGVTIVNAGVGAWVLVYADKELALSHHRASLVGALIGVGLVPSSIAGARLARAVGEQAVLLLNLVLVTSCVVLLSLHLGTIVAAVAVCGVGFCSGFPLAVVLAWFATLRPGLPANTQATLVGALNVLAFSANAIAPPLVGFVKDATGDLRIGMLTLLVGPMIALGGAMAISRWTRVNQSPPALA